MSSTISAKRKQLTLDEKIDIIRKCEEEKTTQTTIAEQYGVDRTTISKILKQKTTLLAEIEAGNRGHKRMRMRDVKYKNVDYAVLMWLKEMRAKNAAVSGPTLLTKATQFAISFGDLEFKASEGWLEKFKHRHGIVCKNVCGEEAAVNPEVRAYWLTNTLPGLLARYAADDIYNADETGIFYQMMPNKTLTFRGEKCSGGKDSKKRITVLVCGNMTGTDKRKLLIIGRSQKPRCFKHVDVNHLGVTYRWNKKAMDDGHFVQ